MVRLVCRWEYTNPDTGGTILWNRTSDFPVQATSPEVALAAARPMIDAAPGDVECWVWEFGTPWQREPTFTRTAGAQL